MTSNDMRSARASMLPALTVPPELRPVIPSWYPLPAEDGTTLPELERHRQRQAKAFSESRRGPWDGQKYKVDFTGGRAPATFSRDDAPGFVYELSRNESTASKLIYRYAPHLSPAHQRMRRAVEEAYADAGPEYATAARLDTLTRPEGMTR